MNLHNQSAEIYISDKSSLHTALARTTHLGIGAHQDDLELIAIHGILDCYEAVDKYFTGVVITNGAGSPRSGKYANYTDEQMQQVRREEQKKAADLGQYSAQFLLDYESNEVKDISNRDVIEDIKSIIFETRPQVIYTHNLADKHDTHMATVLRIIKAIRELPAEDRPKRFYGGEAWRDLDWLPDDKKVVLDVSKNEDLARELVAVFDSQIAGGKRYDLAAVGRRRAHATFYASHSTDISTGLAFAMDLTPFIFDPFLEPAQYVRELINSFADDVIQRISKF